MAKLDKYRLVNGTVLTFKYEGELNPGDAVTFSATTPGVVTRPSDPDSELYGKAITVDKDRGIAAVQVDGIAVFRWSGTLPTASTTMSIAPSPDGSVHSQAGVRAHIVVDVDPDTNEVAIRIL